MQQTSQQQMHQQVPLIQRASHYNSNGNLSTRSAAPRRNSQKMPGQQLNIDNNDKNHFNNNNNGNSLVNNKQKSESDPATTPICRCRVMYLGSSVPHVTKDGLQGIQEPLRDLYPEPTTLMSGNAGIDSWLSVWSNGILLENIDDNGREMKRFFQIDSLHYCAAVKYVLMNSNQQQNTNSNNSNNQRAKTPNSAGNINEVPSSHGDAQDIYSATNSINENYRNNLTKNSKFLPLDSPYSRNTDQSHPPVFACILRRTTGIKVLECHAFICKREAAANALVRCCFHAYADTMYAKQMGADISAIDTNNNSLPHKSKKTLARKSKSIPALVDTVQMVEAWRSSNNDEEDDDEDRLTTSSHITNGHLPTDNEDASRYGGRGCSRTSSIEHQQEFDEDERNSVGSEDGSAIFHSQHHLDQIKQTKQIRDRNITNKLSKSMHQLNSHAVDSYHDHSTSYADINNAVPHQSNWQHENQRVAPQIPVPISGPYTSRVPSYPAHSMMNGAATHGGGTLRSIKSLAANSIASTLLKSKRHAKAMSTSSSHISPSMLTKQQMPMMMGPHGPVPMLFPMPMPPAISSRSMINGSQTLRPPPRPMLPMAGGPPNMPTLSSKELKKLIKKAPKLGLDPTKFGTMTMLPPRPGGGHVITPQQLMHHSVYNNHSPIPVNNGYDTRGDTLPNLPRPQFDHPDSAQQVRPQIPFMAPFRPSTDFLKSKEGKKWMKQQKELKKLLPSHLSNLPIVLGAPPPLDGEPIIVPNGVHIQPSPLPNPNCFPQHLPPIGINEQGLPMPTMDSSGYYNPHPFYGASNNGTSAANTMIRYSPNSEYIKTESGQIFSRGLHQHGDGGQVDPTRLIQHPQYMDHNGHHQNFIGENSSVNYSTAGDSDSYYGNDQASRYPPRYRVPMRPPVMNYQHEIVPQSVKSEKKYAHKNGADIDGASSSRSVHSYKTSKSRSSSKSRLQSDDHSLQNVKYVHQPSMEQQEQMMQSSTDDQNSYSSGIYKKGHINERAFSYSIRQEHRSRGDLTNIDFSNGMRCDEVSVDMQHRYRRDHQQINNQRHQMNGEHQEVENGFVHYIGEENGQKQAMSINDLSARMEHQINMKSFKSKSRSKERL